MIAGDHGLEALSISTFTNIQTQILNYPSNSSDQAEVELKPNTSLALQDQVYSRFPLG